MKNIKNIARGILLLSLLAGASVAKADNSFEANSFIKAQASLKADVVSRLDSAVGAVLGPKGVLRVMGAKVTSVSGNEVKAAAAYGNSVLNFVVKADADTKLNGNSSSSLQNLKAGDKISFSGTIVSSSSSAVVVDADHIIGQALYTEKSKDSKNNFGFDYRGEVKSVNVADNSLSVKLRNGETVKVALTGSAVVTVDGETKTLSSVNAGNEIKIDGSANSDGSLITATKISVSADDQDDGDKDQDRKSEDRREERGGWLQKIRSWFANR